MAKNTTHPLDIAIVNEAKKKGIEPLNVEEFEALLFRLDPDQVKESEEGKKEVEELTGQ